MALPAEVSHKRHQAGDTLLDLSKSVKEFFIMSLKIEEAHLIIHYLINIPHDTHVFMRSDSGGLI